MKESHKRDERSEAGRSDGKKQKRPREEKGNARVRGAMYSKKDMGEAAKKAVQKGKSKRSKGKEKGVAVRVVLAT